MPLEFSADADSKHRAGIQHAGACSAKQERNCRVNDKGIKNEHGVWFIPGGGRNPKPPAHFWDMKQAPRTVTEAIYATSDSKFKF